MTVLMDKLRSRARILVGVMSFFPMVFMERIIFHYWMDLTRSASFEILQENAIHDLRIYFLRGVVFIFLFHARQVFGSIDYRLHFIKNYVTINWFQTSMRKSSKAITMFQQTCAHRNIKLLLPVSESFDHG
mmetsp:Transcript_23498/g.49248  ORF Transcript_23498/g.49248 Transcript_23498/m.49248 type:complete len:131 (-) Transcript_23498:170-562(-)